MMLKYRNSFRGYFLFYYRIVGNRLLLFLLLSMLISFLDSMGLAMFIPLLQSISQQDSNGGSHNQSDFISENLAKLGLDVNVTSVLIVMVALFVFKGLVRLIQLTYYSKLRQVFIRKVRYNLITHLHELSFGSFLKIDPGRIQNTLTVEVQRLFQTMKSYFDAAQAGVMLCTYMLLAFVANFQFALLVATGAFLSNLLYRRIYRATKKASVELSEKGNDFNSFLTQTTTYFKYLKSTNTFGSYAKKLKLVIDQSASLQRRIGNMNAITTSVKEPMIMIMVVLAMIVQVNWLGTSLLSLLLSLMLFYRALNYLMIVQNFWQGFIENIGGMNAVAHLMDEMSSLKEEKGTVPFHGLTKAIEVWNVELSYGARKVLDNVSLLIPRLSTVALVGESGAGKTTIANVIAGLVPPDSGQVLIDGVPLNTLALDSYRQKVGYISQETVIFTDSIFNNITFWAERNEENIRRFNEVVQVASLAEFIALSPQKEDTMLGENGILISGGQKQRISIARELYKNAEILVFDEATSSLDSHTEKTIQSNIEQLYGRYTMIIIAHRLSTIKTADTIYLMEHGTIAAHGSFREMMNRSERFQKLVSLQTFQEV